jgi:NADPH:quinone reductase-like Zn-dependent oxidoreductase
MSIPTTMMALIQKADGYDPEGEADYRPRDLSKWLELAEIPVPTPGPGQVLVKIAGSMVNPSDVMFFQGKYGQPRIKDAAAGFEGVGTVVAGEKGLIGQRVSVTTGRNGTGVWAEYALADAATVIPLRPDIRDEDGAAMVVNPLTAAAMVDLVPEGGAFIASAAASQLGKLMAGLARESNRRLIALVRRDAPIAHLKELGAAHALNETSPDFAADLAAAIKAERPTVFLDAVAGPVSAQVFNAMGADSRWIIYGKLTDEPTEILEPGQMIFQRKRIEGFWLVTWFAKTDMADKVRTIQAVQARFADGRWKTEVSARVPLRQAMEKLPEALQEMDGKVMIIPGG